MDATWRARVRIPADPSSLPALLAAVAPLGVTVMSSSTAPRTGGHASPGQSADADVVDLVLVSPADLERSALATALASAALDVVVAPGIARDVEDVASRVLMRASALVRDPDAAPEFVADLMLADSWEVQQASAGSDSGETTMRIQWTMDRHVVLHRRAAPFTRTERMRASALLSMIAALAEVQGADEDFGWHDTLRDGTPVRIRLARPADIDGVEAMHARCSEESRYQRYFTPMNTWRELNLRRISGGHRGSTIIARTEAGEIIALGNVFPLGPDDDRGAELAVIVDDAWHGRGLGRLMVDHLIELARRLGFPTLTAYVLSGNRAMIGLLESTDVSWSTTHDHDLGPAIVAMVATLD